MRKLSLFLFSLFCINVSAQDISEVGAQNVNLLKAQGKLTGRESYTNKAASPATPFRMGPAVTTPTQASSSCNCWIPRDATFQIGQFDYAGGSGGPGVAPEYRNDDWSTDLINLPFNLCFYGQSINQIYLNNNGNISFGAPYSTFTALSFPDSTYTMIAPFWADVDTRGAGSGLVYYSVTPTHLIVQWDHVGYYASHDTLLNTFQLIITDGTDPLLGTGSNVSFCYKDMQWTTGDASSGQHGIGGIPATVGVNQGNGFDYIQFGLFDSSGAVYDGPYGANDGVDWLDNQSFTFNVCVSGANIPPVLNSLNVCDTVRLCQNTTYQLTANYLSPEQGEITNIVFNDNGMTGVTVLSNTPGNTATLVLEIVGQTSNLGFHTVSATATDNGLPNGVTVNDFVIEVLPTPLPSFTFSPASPIVANTTVQFTNTSPPGTLLNWNFGDATPGTTAPNPSHTFTTAGTYTVSLTALFPNGCTTVATQQIIVSPCSAASFTINNACANSVSTITFTGNASPSAVYSWDFNGGTIISGSGSGPYDVTWSSAGNYNVVLTINEPSCSVSATMPVNVYAIPVATISSVASVCAGDNPVVNFTGSAGPTATYTWNFGNATVVSGSGSGPYTLQWNNPGQGQVSVLVDENGCSDSTQMTVVVNPIPTADFTVPASACSGEALNVNYTGTASAAANYNWDFDSGNINSGTGQGPYSVNWNNGGNYSVTLNVTENGCAATPFSMPVTITPAPVVTLSPVANLCIGATNVVSFTGNAGAGAVFNWNFGNGTVLSGSGNGPYSLQWNAAGQQQITLSVDENGCVAQSSLDLTVYPIPTSDFTVGNAACVETPINFNYTGTASPSANYNWSFTGSPVVNGSGSGPYIVTWNNPGSYQVSLTVTENGCTSPVTNLPADVNPLPYVFAGNDVTVCSGTPAQIGMSSNPGEIYQWSPATDVSNASTSNPVVTSFNQTISTQQQVYIFSVTDGNGCSNLDTVAVIVDPEPVVSFPSDLVQCIENNNFLLTAASNIPTGVNFSWTFTPEASISTSTQQSLAVSYSSVGAFPVLLTAEYNNCPSQPFLDSVHVYEMPVADFIPLVTEGCEPLSVPFNNLSTGNGNTYSWSFTDASTDQTENAVHVFQNSGVYSATLVATNFYGCVNEVSYQDIISVFESTHGHFIPNPPVANILAPIVQFQNYSSNVLTYVWNFGDTLNPGTDTSTVWSPDHQYSQVGDYTVTLMVISPDGCVDTVRGTVKVEENFSFYIPNGFTPNDDGVNDVFRGYGVAIKNYQMNIYNRWGELIYTTTSYDKPWDGKMKSGFVQSDVYVYRIVLTDLHDEKHTYVGDVSLVK